MDEKLKDIFANINDWLKYAEAKSATLIAGNGALIFGMTETIKDSDIPKSIEYYSYMSMTLCLISMIICLLSVVPSLSMPWESKLHSVKETDNLLYFQDISKYTPINFLKNLSSRLNITACDFSGYQKDLAKQIIINSTIACKKYEFFKVAILFTVAALISPLGVLLLIWRCR